MAHLEQALHLEGDDGLAQRGAADPELLGQDALRGELGPGAQVVDVGVIAQLVREELVERSALEAADRRHRTVPC